jgi:hypothetical protein
MRGGRGGRAMLFRLPIPDEKVLALRMQTSFFIPTTIASSSGYIQWQMNNLYQPFLLGTNCLVSNAFIVHANGSVDGDNPNCFVNYCAVAGLYRQYRVLSSGVKIHTQGPVNGGQTIKFALAPTPNLTTFYASFKTAAQAQNSKMLSNYSTIYKPVSMRKNISIHHAVGTTRRNVLDEDGYTAAYNASPTASPSWFLDFITNDDQNLVAAGFQLTLELSWIVKLEKANYTGSTD